MATASTKRWWKNSIVYQIYPKTFCDSNDDGIGDIPGIISKLHYLKDLGVDILWLNPVYASPGFADGYDISDYKQINTDYGTMEDMERLIRRAKRLGIKIVMDLEINHTSTEHEWFKKALEGDPKYRGYYFFRSGNGMNRPPNNWDAFVGGRAWSHTEDGNYYLHLFGEKTADLNWHNPEVFEEFAEIMRFWLDKGIAGFKFNDVNIIYKDSLADGKWRISLKGKEHYLNKEGCHKLLKRFSEEIFAKYKTFTVGEPLLVNFNDARLLSDENRAELDTVIFSSEMDETFKCIKWFNKKYNPFKLIRKIDEWQNTLEVPANYLENLNQIRSVKAFGNLGKHWEQSSKLLCGLNLSLRGVPFIFEGEEIGMTDSDEGAVVRDFYKDMIDFRKNSLALSEGSYRKVASPSDVYIFTREAKEERFYVYCNLTSNNKVVEFYGDKIVFGNYPNGECNINYLKPYEFRIVASNI